MATGREGDPWFAPLAERRIHPRRAAHPGAPWRIRLTDDIRALLAGNTPDGWLATLQATHVYGLSRQTLLQRVKRSEIRAVYLRTGRKKGLRIAPPAQQAGLF